MQTGILLQVQLLRGLVRLFANDFLSVVLVLYLAQVGLTEAQIGLLLTLTLVGDTVIALARACHWRKNDNGNLPRHGFLIGHILRILAGDGFPKASIFIPLSRRTRFHL